MNNIGNPRHDIIRVIDADNCFIISNSDIDFPAFCVRESNDFFRQAVRKFTGISVQFLEFDVYIFSHASFSSFSSFSLNIVTSEKEKVKEISGLNGICFISYTEFPECFRKRRVNGKRRKGAHRTVPCVHPGPEYFSAYTLI